MSGRSLSLTTNPQNTKNSITNNIHINSITTTSLISSLSLSTPSPITFSLSKLHCRSFPILSHAFPSHSHNPNFDLSIDDDDDDDDDQDQVIGDCVVFEDGIFEDPFLQPNPNPISTATHKPQRNRNPTSVSEIEPQNLVPQEWEQLVQEINLTKKERRKISQDMEFGQRIHKNKTLTNLNLEHYLRFRNDKLSQLKPLVVDNPTVFPSENGGNIEHYDDDDLNTLNSSSSANTFTRVEPTNPRWAVYGRGLDDITHFFNSGTYQPSAATDKRQGRQKMFTKEDKFLMNARIPKLADATSQKWLPLHTLAASGEFYLLNNLLKHNVDINAADKDGLTALHKAITGKKQAITNYLLRESANPFVRDKDGASLMHYAVRTASSQAIKTLLLHNVEIDLQDNDGWTPLHLAVQSRRTDVVRLLLMKGADKTLKNKDGLTPLELCLYAGRDVKMYELVKLLKQLPRQRR